MSRVGNVAAGVACGLGALVSVVALASRVALSGSAPVSASSARTPLSALFVLVAGAGSIALGAMTVLLRPGRQRRGDEPERERPALQVNWAWKLAAILVPFALGAALIAAAALGVRILPAPARPIAALPTHRAGATPAPVHGATSFELPSWLPWTVFGTLTVAALAGGWLMLRRSRPLTKEPARPTPTRAAVDAAISALGSTRDPREAVIAAYAAMERTFAARDLGRRPSEAPREYLGRVLRASEAPADAAIMITGLFEKARFSTHPISENARGRALDALSSLHDGLSADGGG